MLTRIPAKQTTGIRLEPQVRRALIRLAREDGRSLSALISRIVTDWLRKQAPLTDKRARVVS